MELENIVNINIQKDINLYFSKNDYKYIKSLSTQNRMNNQEDYLTNTSNEDDDSSLVASSNSLLSDHIRNLGLNIKI